MLLIRRCCYSQMCRNKWEAWGGGWPSPLYSISEAVIKAVDVPVLLPYRLDWFVWNIRMHKGLCNLILG